MSEIQSRPVFAGEFTHAVDKAGRVTIPSQWRLKGEGQCYLAIPRPNGSVLVLPPAEIEKLQEKVGSQEKLSDLDRHRKLTAVFAQSDSLECDKQGRVVLPERIRKHVGIKGKSLKAVLRGALNTFSIWSPGSYAKTHKSDDADPIANLSELGL